MQDEVDKVVQLFLSEHSQALHDRHIAAIDKLCGNNASGFAVRDLQRVAQILELTLQLARQGASHFVDPLCRLIRTLRQPYIKKSATDELKLPCVMTKLLQTLAGALDTQMPRQLQACTAEALADFSSAYNNRPALLELCQALPTPADLQTAQRLYTMHQSFLHKSNMAAPVCQALKAALDSPEALPGVSSSCQAGGDAADDGAAASPDLLSMLMAALLNFSYSPELCKQLLQAGLLELLLELLLQQRASAELDDAPKHATQVVEVLWNLLEHAPAAAAELLSPPSPNHHRQQQSAWQSAAASAGRSCHGSISSSPNTSRHGSRPVSGISDVPSAPKSSCSAASAAWAVPAETEGCTPEGAEPAAAPETAADVVLGSCAAHEHGGSRLAVELVDVLADLFKQQLADTSSRQAKEHRNDTLAVLQHLSSIPACCRALYSSSFMPIALAAAVVPELQPCSNLVPAGAVARDASSYEMKLLLWSSLGNAAAADAICRAAVVEAGLLTALLMVVDEDDAAACAAASRWNPEQLAALRRLAWSVLIQVAPLAKEGFAACGGVTALARHIDHCYASIGGGSCSVAMPGHGLSKASTCLNSSLPASAAVISTYMPVSRSLSISVEPAMRLLQKLVTGDAEMATAFAKQGLVASLLRLLQAPACADAEATRQGLLLVLSELCTAGGSLCQQHFRQADGVAVLLRECERVLHSGVSAPSLAALDCLWRCCLPAPRLRAEMLALDGLDVLLQLLQRGKKCFRSVVLSMLADLLADPRAHPFFLDWHAPALPSSTTAAAAATTASLGASLLHPCSHSNPSTSAPQLLIDIWREQDAARGISGPDGVLASRTRPLAGAGSMSSCLVTEQSAAGGYAYGCLLPERQHMLQCIAAATSPDMLMDKVYACLAQLPADELMGSLAPPDAAVLCCIQQYVKLRQGEVWQDIQQELNAAGSQPTPEDGMRVVSGIEHAELIASRVQEQQAALLGAVESDRAAAEQAHYAAMAAQAIAEARSRVYEKDNSKLTTRERLAAKAHKEEMLKHSITASTAAVGAGSTGASDAAQAAGAVPALTKAGSTGADAY